MHKLAHNVLHALLSARQFGDLMMMTMATVVLVNDNDAHICKLVVLRYCDHTPLGNECSDVRVKFRVWDVEIGIWSFTEIHIQVRWIRAMGG